jgi:outer membrane autotransporter protein
LLGINPNSEMYLRGYGATLNYTSNLGFVSNGFNSSQSYAAIQVGFNWIALTRSTGTLRLGVAGTQGWLSFSPLAVDGHSYGLFNTETLAGTITWQSRRGWYLDGIVMSGIFNGTVNTDAGQAARLYGTSVQGSLEGGYPFHIGSHSLELEPQVQFVYQHLNFPVLTDADGITVDLGNPDQGIFRGGFRLIRPTTGPNGARFTPYFNADVLQGIGASPSVRFANVPFDAGYFGSAVQVGAGITGTLSNNFSAHADASWMESIGSDGGVGASGFRGWTYNGELRWTF